MINVSLTATRYHLAMHTRKQAPTSNRTGKQTSIWLALTVAIGFHTLILLVPFSKHTTPAKHSGVQIELQLTSFTPPEPTPPAPELEPEVLAPIPEPEPEPGKLADTQPDTPPPALIPAPPIRELEHNMENMSEQQTTRLTNSILIRQFVTEESATDRLFGKSPMQDSSEPRREFHYPERDNLIAMLDQPMPEVPFAYTPGLIRFAYDPGFKGELQRFWDVITPEFGWITDNGTEFKCVWVLVIGGCGWK